MQLSLFKTWGKRPSKEKVKEYEKISLNYKNGKFQNQYFQKEIDYTEFIKDDFTSDFKNRKGNSTIPIVKIQRFPKLSNNEVAITWLGHSSSMIQICNKNILIDPVLSNSVSPVPLPSFKRFYKEIPIKANELPNIDAVIISHNHYDHMDYRTIKAIDKKVNQYFVPLGVESYLEFWGIDSNKINVMNWWEESNIGDISISCTPSNHFSGRNLFDSNTSLWSSWVIRDENHSIFYSGDSAYGTHYKKINEKYGDMDIVLIECGQYNKAWHDVHMMPNESLKACMDLNAKKIIPVHWGAFSLSSHKWNEPGEKMYNYSKNITGKMIIPRIGESIKIDTYSSEIEKWWDR